MAFHLGVDVGTTYTAAAVWRDGTVEIAGLGNRTAVAPTAVAVLADGTLVVGDAALRRGRAEPERVAREFKRRLGDPVPLIVGGSPWSADMLVGRVLEWVLEQVSEREGEPPAGVVMTHPANWGDYKRELMREAFRSCAIDGVTLASEPEASAVHYAAKERVEPDSIVAVYDLGGGTFDVAVLRKRAAGWELLGEPQGIERLGGVDFDEAVFHHITTVLGGSVVDAASSMAVDRLRHDCVEAKEALSSDSSVSVPVFVPGSRQEVRLTRGEFEEMIRPTLAGTITALERALRVAEVRPEDLNAVLLMGGSSRIPLVADLVGRAIGRPVAVDAHPKHGTALGAAIIAASRDRADSESPVSTPATHVRTDSEQGERTAVRDPGDTQRPAAARAGAATAVAPARASPDGDGHGGRPPAGSTDTESGSPEGGSGGADQSAERPAEPAAAGSTDTEPDGLEGGSGQADQSVERPAGPQAPDHGAARSSPTPDLRRRRRRRWTAPAAVGSAAVLAGVAFLLWWLQPDDEPRRHLRRPGLLSTIDPDERVSIAEFSPDGGFLATGRTADSSVPLRLWDTATGAEVASIDDVYSFEFSPDGKLIATEGGGPGFRLWDPYSGEPIPIADTPVYALDFSPVGGVLAAELDNGRVMLWDAAARQGFATVQMRFGERIQQFSVDGTLIAIGDGSSVRLWDVATQQDVATIVDAREVIFSPVGANLAVVPPGEGPIRLLDATTYDEVAHIARIDGSNGIATAVFSPDGSRLCVLHRSSAELWDVTTGQKLKGFESAYDVTFSPESDLALVEQLTDGFRLWDVAFAESVEVFEGFEDVEMFPLGDVLAIWDSQDEDDVYTLRLWDVAVHQDVAVLDAVDEVLAFAPDGERFAVSSPGGGTVQIWNKASL